MPLQFSVSYLWCLVVAMNAAEDTATGFQDRMPPVHNMQSCLEQLSTSNNGPHRDMVSSSTDISSSSPLPGIRGHFLFVVCVKCRYEYLLDQISKNQWMCGMSKHLFSSYRPLYKLVNIVQSQLCGNLGWWLSRVRSIWYVGHSLRRSSVRWRCDVIYLMFSHVF
jgi:hypothetical protein